MWIPKESTVFVRKAAPKTETEGGIILPTEQVGLTLEGTVAVSNNNRYPVGLKVLFSKFAGSEVTVAGESLVIMQVDDVLAAWREES